MKTAMQFLKEEIESKVFPPEYNNGNLTDYQYGHNIAYSVVLTLAEYLIEVEKEQIINAYTNGYRASFIDGDNRNFSRPQEYYNETYNQKETLEEWKSKFTHHCAIKTNNL